MKRLFVCLFLVGVSYAATKPNIVLIMVDDMGYSDIGCYGAEILTPNLDTLAANGIRFREFYNTAKCFPTRACLVTGVYAHQNGFASDVTHLKNSVTLGEVLGAAGYHTYASGKHHSLDNLYDRGFDHYYGLRDGACNHFNPGLQRDGEDAPANKGIQRYWADDALVFNTRNPDYQHYFPPTFYTTDAFTAKAQEYLTEWETEDTGRPFFLYLAYTAPHDPVQAWADDIAKYDNVYDVGYNTIRNARYQKQLNIGLLTEQQHPLSTPEQTFDADSTLSYQAWDNLSQAEQADEARRMQVYAAMIDCVDQRIGDLMTQLQNMGVYDDTLILFCSDNGASPGIKDWQTNPDAVIGDLDRYTAQGAHWANVNNSPFRQFKTDAEEGGIRSPLIAHWPNGIVNPGRFTDKTAHLIDFMATFVDITGADYPRFYGGTGVTPMQGDSFADVLYDQTVTRNKPLYFEYSDGRVVRDGDYKLVSDNGGSTYKLFDMTTDATELDDLSSSLPSVKSNLLTKFNTWWTAVNNNDLPTAYDDTAQVTYPGSVDIDVLSNDADFDGSIDASTLVITRDPNNGTAVINPDDTIKYTVTEAFVTDEFYYQVRDNDGEISNEGRVTVSSQDAPPPVDDVEVYIVIESGNAAELNAMTGFLNDKFAGRMDTITSGSYESAAPPATANDLVIIMRALNNGGYDDSAAEVTGWNSLTAPILMLSPFQADDDNLGWITSTTQLLLTSPAGAETLVTSDPLFDGVTVTGGYADLIVDGTAYKANPASGFVSTDVVGSTDAGAIVLARIAAGSAWASTNPASGTHGGDRIVFQFHKNPAGSNGLYDDLTADGQTVLENAIDELLPDAPPANNAPSFTSDPINKPNATEDKAYSGTLADVASDPESDPMTFSKEGGPDWLVVNPTNGALSGTPGDSNVGTNVFTVKVDATGGADTATLNIEVLNIYSGVRGIEDLAGFAAQWLTFDCETCFGADLSGEGNVTLSDFAIFAGNWLAGT